MDASQAAAQPQVFLSPHLDDAALSAGGTIHRLAVRGVPVTVLTVCAAAPPEAALSTYAQALHTRWGQPTETARTTAAAMVARRRAEDRAACRRLGATVVHLRWPDLIYRREADGRWAAERDADLFAGAAGVDRAAAAALAMRLRRRLEQCPRSPSRSSVESAGPLRLWVPLGIGDHVDHHLCRLAAEALVSIHPRLVTLRYYEDYPYAGDNRARAKALSDAPVAGCWQALEFPIDAGDLAARLDAIACFRTQISSFWSDEQAMRAAVARFAKTGEGKAGWSERFWEVATAAADSNGRARRAARPALTASTTQGRTAPDMDRGMVRTPAGTGPTGSRRR